jgi:4-hydroxy-2-oxoheptanedioate aldolase
LGFDFAVLDWQHGEWTEHTVTATLPRLRHTATVPMVRVPRLDAATINRVLDMGAMGVVVPMIETAEEAAAAVKAAMYVPKGNRSGGGSRLGWMAGGTADDYFAQANEQMLVAVMVESQQAVAHSEQIMSVPGVAAVIIGPGDLMLDLASRGLGQDAHDECARQLVEASRKTGVPAGFVCTTAPEGERRVAEGFRFLWCGNDRKATMESLGPIAAAAQGWKPV